MADFTALKTAIQNAIKQNGNEEITGNLLQEVLLAIVTTLGDGSINDLITALGTEATTRGNADTTLQQNIDAEALARGNADTALGGRIDGVVSSIEAINDAIENGYVYAGIATPSSTPASGKVFYLALTAGTYTNFGNIAVTQGINILKYNGSAWSLDAFVGIDDTPTPKSNELVKSGGVFNDIMTNGSAFDLTAYNNGTTYEDLNAALTALNALPAAYKKGGMSMKFVRTYDNKYVQYRLMNNTFSTTESDWQGVDDEPTAGSDNLVKSGSVYSYTNDIRAEILNLNLTDAYYVIVNNVIDYVNPSHDHNWRGLCIDCIEGDMFLVKAKTVNIAIPIYAFIDNEGNVISTTSELDLSDKDYNIIAPSGTNKVCFNSNISSEAGYSNPTFHRLGNVLKKIIQDISKNTENINNSINLAPFVKKYCYIDNGVFIEGWSDANHRYHKIQCNKGDYISIRYLNILYTTVNVTCAFIDSSNNVLWEPFKGNCAENVILKAPENSSYFVLVYSTAVFTENDAEIPFEVYKLQPNRINEQRAVVGELIQFHSGYIYPSNPQSFTPGTDASWVYSVVKCSGNERFVLNTRTTTSSLPIAIICDINKNAIDTVTIEDCYENGFEYITPLRAEFIIFNHAIYSTHTNYKVVRYGNGSTSYNQSIKELSKRIDSLDVNIIGIDVKKDGSGDFTTIQAAINSITDASPSKRYEVRIYDDFTFEDADMFNYHSGPCAVVTKDYVDLVGMNGVRKLTYLPSSDKTTSQILWWVGNSNLKNLHFTITRGRYAVHGTYAGFNGADIERYAENCVFEHIVVPSVSWDSQYAFAEDVWTNQKEHFVICKFISKIGGAAGHTMDVAYQQFKTEISFENCEFIVPNNINCVGYSSIGTYGDYQIILKECIVNGIINGYSAIGSPSNYSERMVNPHYNVFNCGDSPYKSGLLRNLTIVSSSKTIKSINGTSLSLIFGDIKIQRDNTNGIDSYIVGSYDLTYYANPAYSTGYKHSLAYRLGDCSGTNKTLVITYSDNTSETIVFDKNYRGSSDGTTEPAYTNEHVMAEINTQLSNSEAYYQIPASIYDYYMDSDLKVLKVNKTTSVIQQGKFVTESLGGGIELADYTNYIGFALIDVPNKNEGLPSPICISKKIILGQSYSPSVSNTTDETTYTIQNGALVESSINVVGVVYDNILYLK